MKKITKFQTLPTVGAAVLLASAAVAIGCGSDDDTSSVTTSVSTSSAPRLVPIGVAESGGKVDLVPPPVVRPGAVEIELTNTGREPHAAQIVRVEGVHAEREILDAYSDAVRGGPVPDWLLSAGGVATTQPDTSSSVVQELEPGNYWILDDEGNPTPNYLNGGAAMFTVGGQPDEAAQLPSAAATVTASEYAFEAEGLEPGANEVSFVNAGAEPHHLIAAPLLAGKTADDLNRETLEGDGPPPVDFERAVATAVIEGGQEQVVEIELDRGRYALLCFISDREGGPPHAFEGMVGETEVE